jgi:preprotein translocase subunit SecB
MAPRPHNVDLIQYFFPETFVRAVPDHDRAGTNDGTVQHLTHQIEELQTDTLQHGVSIRVSTDDDKSENQPYSYSIEAYGIFGPTSAESDQEIEDYRKNVEIVGVQILLGAIREHLASVTARSPWSTFIMGTANLMPKAEAKTDDMAVE